MLGGDDYVATARLTAASAGLCAGAPFEPVRLNAINWTRLRVALLGLYSCWALHTAVGSGLSDFAITGTDSTAAGLAAG